MDPLYIIFPLVAAAVYALSSIFVKAAMDEGVGPARALFISNWLFFVLLLPVGLIVGVTPPDWSLWWVPVIAGMVVFGGALFSFLALKYGDVSVATPLLGMKVVFVALLSTLILREWVPLSWWIGAVMTALAIYLLGGTPPGALRRNMSLTIAASMGSALCFALLDILTTGWANRFGLYAFIILAQLSVALWSFLVVPFFTASLRTVTSRGLKWLAIGTALLALQFVLVFWTLATFGKPTGVNILYGSRGLWSLVFIVAIGPWLGNFERSAGRAVLARRTLGSCLLLVAIAVVLFEGGGNSP